MANVYDTGDIVRISTVTLNDAGTAADPNALTLTVQDGGGTETVYAWPTPGIGQVAMIKDSVGNFHADHLTVADGLTAYRWAATGAVTSAAESYYIVRQSLLV